MRKIEPFLPAKRRQRAIEKAVGFVTERLNGEDGLGAIFPPMANTVMMFDCLGYKPDHPDYATALGATRKLLAGDGDRLYCQPCLSPVWDTTLACHALMEVGDERLEPTVRRALDWIAGKQVLDVVGDWAVARPTLRPGGWAFQYENPHYPDLDDTAAAGLALDRFDAERYRHALDRAAEWIDQGCKAGTAAGAAFDADNTHYLLNHISFADHGALLDPPTADVTARCLGFLAQLGQYGQEAIMLSHRRRSPSCGASEGDGNAGSAGGVPMISTEPGRCLLPLTRSASIPPRRRYAARSRGCSPGSIWTAAGASAPRPIGPNCRMAMRPTAPRRRRPLEPLLGLMAAGEAENLSGRPGHRLSYRKARVRTANGTSRGIPRSGSPSPPRLFTCAIHGYTAFFPLLGACALSLAPVDGKFAPDSFRSLVAGRRFSASTEAQGEIAAAISLESRC